MTVRRAARVAALLALLLPALTARSGASARFAAAPGPDATGPVVGGLTTVADEARLPDTGHVRFVRSSPDGLLLFVGLSNGALERSADGGRTWQLLSGGVPGGPGVQTLDLQISPADPHVVWAAGLSGVFRSTDEGLSWMEADTLSSGPGRALGSVLALDPRHPEAAYLAGYRNGGLYRTGDGGLSWQEVIPYPVSGVAVEPADGAIIYAISRTAGVQRSDDHGLTWSTGVPMPVYAGIGLETASAGRLLAIDGPGGGLYVALDGGGLWRSLDGGLTWQDLSGDLPQSAPGQGYDVPFDLSVTGGPQPQLYLILPGPSGGTLYGTPLPTVLAPLPSGAGQQTPSPAPPSATATLPAATSTAGEPGLTPMDTPPAGGTPEATPTLTPTETPTPQAPAVTWQALAAHVDAVAPWPPGGASLALAAEAPPSSGMAARLAVLGGSPLLNIPYLLPQPPAGIAGGGFRYGNTTVPYLYGVNYEGPRDRPWRMWEDGRFDPVLLARDLDAAAATGYRVLRIFVQDPLPQQILAGEFGHLDTLVSLARQRDLRLLITCNDSGDPELARVAMVDRLLAAHLAGNPTIFGYDLRNEPHFQDIIGAIYPPGSSLPLLDTTSWLAHYKEHYSWKAVRAGRAAGKWQGYPYDHLSDRQTYAYLNANAVLQDFFAANPGYPSSAPDARWQPLLQAIDASLAVYIRIQREAIRGVDPGHLITIGYNSDFWSSLPANGLLDFRSIHLYPASQDFASIHSSLRYFEDLRQGAQSPLVLEEYGFSTAAQPDTTASIQETAMALYLRVLGGAGDFKWMLNDDAVGYNPYENALGLFGADGSPKAGYYIDRALAAYFDGPHRPGGVRMWDDPASGVGYLYAAADALGLSGAAYSDPRLTYSSRDHDASAELWLDWSQPGLLRLVCTHGADLAIDLGALANARPGGPLALSPDQAFSQDGLRVRLHLQAGVWYTLTFTPADVLPVLPPELPRPVQPAGWYILASGHNVLPPLLQTWLDLGGTAVAGSPIDDARPAAGGAVQYFTAVALQAGADGVHLLPLGLRLLGGAPLPATAELPRRVHHRYFPDTGHNLRGAFLTYWQATGGLARWGAPLSEELARNGLTIQYFANAAFAWDGARVSLAPLGARAWSHGAR